MHRLKQRIRTKYEFFKIKIIQIPNVSVEKIVDTNHGPCVFTFDVVIHRKIKCKKITKKIIKFK